MANPAGKLVYKLVTIAVGIPVGIAARKGVEKAWRAARPNDPPRKASDPEVSWKDAAGWAALSAAGVAIGQLITYKGAASIYRGLTGSEPPAKAPKKLEPPT
jgi:Protein of unknown function (DUF4235)